MKSHIIWHPEFRGVIEEVRCIDCQQTLRKLVRSERVIERVQTGNVIREYCLAALVTLNTYDEVEIEMEDGGKHVVPVCKSCKMSLAPSGHEALWEASKEAMREEAAMAGSKPPPAKLMAMTTMAEKGRKDKDAAVEAARAAEGGADAGAI